MVGWSRRRLLTSMALAAAGQGAVVQTLKGRTVSGASRKQAATGRVKLALEDYEPKSMLHVPETKVPRARFPAIDFHAHLSWSNSRKGKNELHNNATPDEVLSVMDR